MANNCLIHFYMDSEGEAKINHLNNSAEELKEYLGLREEYPMLLFAYSYEDRKLFVENLDSNELVDLLELLKRSRSESISSSEKQEAVRQLDLASNFLKTNFSWKGEIFPKEEMESSFIGKSIRDFNMVWKYLTLIFGSMRLDPIDIPVFIVSNLEQRSVFVQTDKMFDTGMGEVQGPAIIVRKTNSMFFMCQSIIYQYVLNLHGIIDFSPGIEETYLSDAKEFVDRTLISFLRNNDLEDRSFWYVAKKDGHLYLNENDDRADVYDLESAEGYSSVITFEYMVVEDSRYIIVNEISAEDLNISDLYKSMMQFVQDNLSYVGHVDENGEELKTPPVYLFEGLSLPLQTLRVTNLPVWIYIQTVLSAIYDFDPKDILIIRGEFPDSFAFRYMDPSNEDDKKYISEYVFEDQYNEPLILWNTSSYDSMIAQWNKFSQEYMKFIDPARGKFENVSDIIKMLRRFQATVLRRAENRFAFESLIALICEEYPHIHRYNVFGIFTKVVGLTGIVTENTLENNENAMDEETMKVISEVQSSLFFLTLKTLASFCNIKHGTPFTMEGTIQKGDIVTDKKCQCLLEVKVVKLEPDNITNDNPEGITYECENLICGRKEVKTKGELELFHLGFLDEEAYNEKTASKMTRKANQPGEEFYKSMLDRFLRNKKRPNPLDHTEDKDSDPPSFDALLRKQRKDFNRTEGDAVLENMLNDCRKVKTYGD